MTKTLVIHGVNLNLLGKREPALYGVVSLDEVDKGLSILAHEAKQELESFQSNSEHEIVNRIQKAADDKIDYIIINPGAYTHTSIAIRDALLGVAIPFIEVHISNIYSRETFRHTSYLSDIAMGCIIGLGAYGYKLALLAIINTK